MVQTSSEMGTEVTGSCGDTGKEKVLVRRTTLGEKDEHKELSVEAQGLEVSD